MGRKKKDTIRICGFVGANLVAKLARINPAIVKSVSESGHVEFRHGAIGKYLGRLVAEDLEAREKLMQDELLQRFAPKQKEEGSEE